MKMVELTELRKLILGVIEKNSRIDVHELSVLLGATEIAVSYTHLTLPTTSRV